MEQKSFVSRNRLLLGIGAAIFFTLSGLLYYNAPVDGHYEVDSSAYDRVARVFLKTGKLSESDGTPPIHTQGYHLFLAILYWLFGTGIGPIVFIQVLLAFFSIVLTTRAALLMCGSLCAQIVYGLAVVDGAFLVYPQFVLADTLLLFLITVFLERIAVFYVHRKTTILIQAGLVLGLSLIVKPTAMFLPICFATCFALGWLFYSISVSWRQLGIFCIALYFFPLLYVIRNGLTFGAYTFSFLMDFNLYCWFPALLLSKVNQTPFDQCLREMQSCADIQYTCFQSGYWKPLQVIFFELVQSHPLLVLSVWIQNLLKTFFGLFSVQLQLLFDPTVRDAVMPFFGTQGSLMAKVTAYVTWAFRSPIVGTCMVLEFLTNGARWLLVLLGVASLWQQKKYDLLIFFFCIVGCFSVVTGFFGAGRYRTTFEPILLIVAASGLISLYKTYKRIKLEAFKKA